ncbi:MAG: NBR1-Ig-like domain-containing protein [Candidatus Nanoarchaeia archaeon]|nr:NBR1-Ig-like domain-containing protein [Candidatus Nanoarchaeia archaeon]MDD4988721.1 NBR1-Ig-like domain-containing protein [Candidatus Izemoplasmatales bacterium]
MKIKNFSGNILIASLFYFFFGLTGVVAAGEYVTVGHQGSGADYICDGVDDANEINQALATKKTVKLITDGSYNIGSTPITIPGNDVIYELTANTPANPPTIKATVNNSRMVWAENGRFNISHLNFDGNGKFVHCIEFTSSAAGSAILHNNIFGFNSNLWNFVGYGIYGRGQNTINIGYNTIRNGYGLPIALEGKTDPDNRGEYAKVYYNQILNNKMDSALGAINGEHLHIYNNNIVSFGVKNNTYSGSWGFGIIVSRSKIEYNVVRGTGNSGIISRGKGDSANNAYSLIDHNICEYNGANGIDYWYSDGSVVTNNQCNDNGQIDDANSWDRDGIDVCDHSQNTIVSNNEATNKASTIIDSVKNKGTNYVEVNNFSRWYDYRNGANVPFDGMYVSIGGSINRIDYIDMAAQRLYLFWLLDGGVQIGSKISGIDKQLIGINVADNGQSLGGHTGSGNNVYGNLQAQIIPTINGSKLSSTNITADGTGPVPAFNSGVICGPGAVIGCQVCNAAGKAWVDTDNKCANDQTCSGGICVDNKKVDLSTCTSASECLSDICLDGYCGLKPNGWGCSKNDVCASAVCINNLCVVDNNAAEFLQQSIPVTMVAGQTYPVSIIFENIGTNNWNETNQYRLGSQNPQDNGIWREGRVYLAAGEEIAPGQAKTFTFDVKAPATPGAYNFQWQMVQDGVEWFGDKTPNVAVAVVSPAGCVAKTCASLGNYQCGSWSDGCGAMVSCGTCTSGKTCNASGRCVSQTAGAPVISDSNPQTLAETPQKMTRAEILQKIAEVKQLLIQLIIQLIAELQKQLAAMPK